jgi:hypothetical protein
MATCELAAEVSAGKPVITQSVATPSEKPTVFMKSISL